MKKLLLMISAAVGAIVPFGKADAANCTYRYEYTGGTIKTTSSSASNAVPGGWIKKTEDCGLTKTETEKDLDSGGAGIYTTTETRYNCENDVCTKTSLRKTLEHVHFGWTKVYYYGCNNVECNESSMTETDEQGVYRSYTCSGSKCYNTYSNYGNKQYYYNRDGNSVEGYADQCGGGLFTANFSDFDDSVFLKCVDSNKSWREYGQDYLYEQMRPALAIDKDNNKYCNTATYLNGNTCNKCPGNSASCDIEKSGDYAGKLKSVCGNDYFYTDEGGNLVGGYDDALGVSYTCYRGSCVSSKEPIAINALRCPDYTSPTDAISNCASGFNGVCVTCDDSFFLKDYKCVKDCGEGFYVRWGTSCYALPEGCDIANNSNKCTSCKDRYYLENGNCKELPENCVEVSSGKCIACKSGNYLDENKDCKSCPENVDSCKITTDGDFKGNLVSYCGNDYYYTDRDGNLVGGYDDLSGSSYTCSNGVCIGSDGAKLSELRCPQYTAPANALPEGCSESLDGKCTSCDTFYFLKEGNCVNDCGVGNYAENGECFTLPTGCADFSGGKCHSCIEGYLNKNGFCIDAIQGCGAGFKQIENWCNRIQYTPAEAAQVLRNDNTNEVTITFRK